MYKLCLKLQQLFFCPQSIHKKNPPDLVLAVLFRRIKSKVSKVDWIEFSEGLTAKVQKCKLITVYIVTCIIYILEPVYNYMCHNFCIQSLCKDTMSRFCDKTVILVNPVYMCLIHMYPRYCMWRTKGLSLFWAQTVWYHI